VITASIIMLCFVIPSESGDYDTFRLLFLILFLLFFILSNFFIFISSDKCKDKEEKPEFIFDDEESVAKKVHTVKTPHPRKSRVS
jgi:cbb3-type cytochrome oxidase subunit 3